MERGDPSATGWTEHFPAAITICDDRGTITSMNEAAATTFQADGGKDLIGKNVLDCHPEPSRTQLQGLLSAAGTNVYTIEKAGKRKLIYQAPWFRDGIAAGLVEISIPLPDVLPHFVREG